MSYTNQQNDTSTSNDCGCTDTLPWPTQKKTINKFREDYCSEMYVLLGETRTLEVRKTKLDELIGKKQCWFVWSERNYRINRNLDLLVGTELAQTNDSIKEAVKTYQNGNKNLADALKKLVKSVKDVRDKSKEFRDAACKLRDCKDDTCNCSQIYELTGEKTPGGGCGENAGPRSERKGCSDTEVKDILNHLIKMPQSLFPDVDAISKSATNVMGIQTFSNITTLDPMQAELAARIKKFGTQVAEGVKKSEGELKSAIDEFTKSKKELAKTDVELYAKRSDFEGLKKTVAYFCCLPCTCVEDSVGDLEQRLHKCEHSICDICKKVKDSSCGEKAATDTQVNKS